MKMIQQGEERMDTKLYVIIPCFNEEEVLPVTVSLFLEELQILIRKGKIGDRSIC